MRQWENNGTVFCSNKLMIIIMKLLMNIIRITTHITLHKHYGHKTHLHMCKCAHMDRLLCLCLIAMSGLSRAVGPSGAVITKTESAWLRLKEGFSADELVDWGEAEVRERCLLVGRNPESVEDSDKVIGGRTKLTERCDPGPFSKSWELRPESFLISENLRRLALIRSVVCLPQMAR